MAHRTDTTALPSLELALTHSHWLTRLAESLVRDAGVARDLSAQALERLQPRDDVRDERAFLARVVERLAVRHRRGEARRVRRERAAAEALRSRAGASPAAADVAADLETQRLLLEAVSALREPSREALVLRYYHGMSAAEIARSRGVSPAAARKRLQRATEELRQHLDRTHASREAWIGAIAPLAGLAGPGTPSPAAAAIAFLGGPAKLIAAVTVAIAISAALILLGGGGGGAAPPPMAPRVDDETAADLDQRDTEDLTAASDSAGERIGADAEREPGATPAAARTVVTLTGPDGAPLSATTALVFDGSAEHVAVLTDDAGRIEFAEGEGERTIAVARPSGLPHLAEVALEDGDQRIEVPRGAAFAGTVAVDRAPPADAMELRVLSDRPYPADARIRDAIEAELGAFDTLRVAAGSGAFRFDGLPDDWRGSLELPRGLRRRGTQFHMVEHDHVPVEGPAEAARIDLVSDVIVTARIVEADGETPVPRATGFVGLAWEDAPVSGGYSWRADAEGRVRFALFDRRTTRFDLRFARSDGTAPTEIDIPREALERSLDLGDLPLVEERSVEFLAVDEAGAPVDAAVAYAGEGNVLSPPSGPDGRGTLRGLPVSVDRIEVVAPGFAPTEARVPSDPDAVVKVVLATTNVLEIVVLDPDGAPEPRAGVRVNVPNSPGSEDWARDIRMLGDASPGAMQFSTGAGRDAMSYGLVTDDLGRVTLQRLPTSVPITVAALDGSSAPLVRVEVLPLAPDERRTLELRLDVHLRDITGVVVDSVGRPIAGARVGSSRDVDALVGVTSHSAGMVSWAKRVDDEGRFELRGTSAVDFALTANAPGHAMRTIRVGEGDDDLRIALEPGRDITIRVVDAAGEPLDDVSGITATGPGEYERWIGEDNNDGTWRLGGLPLRSLTLEVEAEGATLGATLEPGRGDHDVVVR